MIKSQKVYHQRLKCARSRHTQRYQSHIVVICVHPLLSESPERHLRFQVFWSRRGGLGAELSVLLNQAAALTETIPSMELYSGHKYLSLASGASCRVMSNKCFWREEKKQNKNTDRKKRKREEKPAGTTHQYSRGAPETADRFSPPQTFPALRTWERLIGELLFCCGWGRVFFLPFSGNIFVILSTR